MLFTPLRHWTYRSYDHPQALRYFSVWSGRSLYEGSKSTELHPSTFQSVLSNSRYARDTRNFEGEEGYEASHSDPGSQADVPRPHSAADFEEEDDITGGYHGQSRLPHRLHRSDSRQDGEFSSADVANEASYKTSNEHAHSGFSTQRWRILRSPPQTRSLEEALEFLKKAFDSEDEEGLLHKVWEIARDNQIAGIPSTAFIEILRKLDPCDDFLPFRSGYAERVPKHYHMLASQNQQSFKHLKERRQMYQDICNSRVRHGRDLNVREYSQLLKCARSTWDGRFASQVMMDMISKEVQPDLACYNYYFEAKCWSDAWYPSERQILRVFPHALRGRHRFKRHISDFVTIHPYRIGPKGLKSEITHVFTHMIEGGIMADGKAFGSLVTALAREGDIEGVKTVIKKAWEVDVDAIDRGKAENSKVLHTSSSLYPNQDLLFIIAHAFASNNDVPTALRVVDIFSRTFSVTISQCVWAELLEWSFTLSTRRYKKRKEDGAQLGQLAVQTTENLWHVLTSEPYNCKPTLPMYDKMIRGLRRRDRLFPMLKYILEGLELHQNRIELYHKHSRSLPLFNPESHERALIQLQKQKFASFVAVSRWFSLLLSGQRWLSQANRSRIVIWQRQLLPDAVCLFWRYRPRQGVQYTMETGLVHLQENKRSVAMKERIIQGD